MIALICSIVIVISSEIIWCIVYWHKGLEIAKFESDTQVGLNTYSVSFAGIYSSCVFTKIWNWFMIIGSSLIPLPLLIILGLEIACIAKRGSLPKVTGTIEELCMLESKVVNIIENWRNIMARRKLLFKRLILPINIYYMLCTVFLFPGIFSIFNTLCFVALGLVLKAQVFMPYVMGVIMFAFYINLSFQNFFNMYNRLKHAYFKQVLTKCTVNASKSSAKVLQNISVVNSSKVKNIKTLSNWHLIKVNFKQVWLCWKIGEEVIRIFAI